MTLILNNDDIASVLTMDETIGALRQAYEELARTEAVCRPRIDIRIPTSRPNEDVPVGHHGGRLRVRLLRHPHEVGTSSTSRSTAVRAPRRSTASAPASSAASSC